MKYYLGIDAGGTYTRFVMFDDMGNPLDSRVFESMHYMQVGFDGIASILNKGRIVFEKLGYDFDIVAVAIGTAGYGSDMHICAQIETAIWSVFPRALIMSDAQFAMTSALKNQDGVYLIAGTGSIAMRKIGCAMDRRGGFGYLLGDEGSAFWIGRQLLSIFTQEADGRLPRTAFYDCIMKHFELNAPYDLVILANKNLKNYRNFVAQISGIAASCVHLEHIASVYQSAGYELARLANSFELNGKTPIAFGGGVLLKNETVREELLKHLDTDYCFIEQTNSVEYAAYILLK